MKKVKRLSRKALENKKRYTARYIAELKLMGIKSRCVRLDDAEWTYVRAFVKWMRKVTKRKTNDFALMFNEKTIGIISKTEYYRLHGVEELEKLEQEKEKTNE